MELKILFLNLSQLSILLTSITKFYIDNISVQFINYFLTKKKHTTLLTTQEESGYT